MTKTRSSHPLRGAVVALLVGAATQTLSACGGGDECPTPVFGEPVTVTWATTVDPVNLLTPVTVRWSTTNDPLPERYYEPFDVFAPADSGRIPVSAVRRTGTRELTFDMSSIDAYVRDRPRFTATLNFPDPQGYAACRHPGRGDSYLVDVTFDFDASAHTATARFGEPQLVAGGCSVATPGVPASRGGAAMALAAAWALSRRRAARRR